MVLTGQPVVLTHLTLQSECCVPNKPLGPAASPGTLLAGTSPGSAYKQTGQQSGGRPVGLGKTGGEFLRQKQRDLAAAAQTGRISGRCQGSPAGGLSRVRTHFLHSRSLAVLRAAESFYILTSQILRPAQTGL